MIISLLHVILRLLNEIAQTDIVQSVINFFCKS